MEVSLGEETQGPTPDSLKESNSSDFPGESLSLSPEHELEAIPVEEIQDFEPENLREFAAAETTQDTKPENGQVQQRGYFRLKGFGMFLW